MKRIALSLALALILSLLAVQAASATDLPGKFGVGVRADGLGLRYFFTENFAGDFYFSWMGGTRTGEKNNSFVGFSLAPMYVNEIFDRTLLEIGATFDGWVGEDHNGSYKGYGIYPFVGAEYLLGDNFGVDFKLFLGAYSYDSQGSIKTTDWSVLDGSLGMHLYF